MSATVRPRRLARRFQRAAALTSIVLSSACGGGSDGVAGPTTGSLSITVAGLPSGTPATITVTSTAGFARSLTAAETLQGLAPGGYTVTATAVTATDGRYAPTPATQTVTVVAGNSPATAVVTYALATGSLTVTVSGLPTSVNAAVTVTGPSQFSRTVTATTTFGSLEPGTYAVGAVAVTANDDRYAPAAPDQSVVVSAGPTPAATAVAYALASGRLTINIAGLPAGSGVATTGPGVPAAANASVTVTGPAGFLRTITATTLLAQLTPGSYTVSSSNVVHQGLTYRPTPTTQTVNVAASTTPATASVAYATSEGTLAVIVTGLPQGVNASIVVSGPAGSSQPLTGTTTLTALAPGAYAVASSNVITGTTTFLPEPGTLVANVVAGSVTTVTVEYAAQFFLRMAPVATGLDRPVYLVAPNGDPRLFVVEQTGRIRIIKDGQVVAQPFLDLAARILTLETADAEYGLLGLAFHPQFATNGNFFVFYMDLAQDLVVERYQVSANPDVANSTGSLVLKIPHRIHRDHNGGGLMFGPDGFLYISVGDGGCCVDPLKNAQDLNSLLGKVLRLDVSTPPYGIPPTNPFVGQAGKRGEIWAYGLRNPWRIDIDPVTSVLYVADVGEDDYEEVDAVPLSASGVNFGWNIMEGTRCVQAPCSSQGLQLPIVEYPHSEGCSITGGFVYRGTQIPELRGHYFYSDFCSGFLRSVLFSNGVATRKRDWNIPPLESVTSFGRDGSGELYVLTLDGTVFRIVRQ